MLKPHFCPAVPFCAHSSELQQASSSSATPPIPERKPYSSAASEKLLDEGAWMLPSAEEDCSCFSQCQAGKLQSAEYVASFHGRMRGVLLSRSTHLYLDSAMCQTLLQHHQLQCRAAPPFVAAALGERRGGAKTGGWEGFSSQYCCAA